MCIAVVVATQVCPVGHISESHICWRQCLTISEYCVNCGIWENHCEDANVNASIIIKAGAKVIERPSACGTCRGMFLADPVVRSALRAYAESFDICDTFAREAAAGEMALERDWGDSVPPSVQSMFDIDRMMFGARHSRRKAICLEELKQAIERSENSCVKSLTDQNIRYHLSGSLKDRYFFFGDLPEESRAEFDPKYVSAFLPTVDRIFGSNLPAWVSDREGLVDCEHPSFISQKPPKVELPAEFEKGLEEFMHS